MKQGVGLVQHSPILCLPLPLSQTSAALDTRYFLYSNLSIMLFSSTLVAGITLATAASAAPVSERRWFFPWNSFNSASAPTSAGTCSQQRVPVTVTAENTVISMSKPAKQGALTGFLANYWATGSTTGAKVIPHNVDGSLPRKTVKGTYNIWTQLCMPNGWKDGGVAHIGIHGYVLTCCPAIFRLFSNDSSGSTLTIRTGSLDTRRSTTISRLRTRLDMPYSPTIVWVRLLLSGFTRPKLTSFVVGVGQSDKPDGLDVVQSAMEVEILHTLIQNMRSSGKFSKVVGIGHSYGS